jgi:manganese transport protein
MLLYIIIVPFIRKRDAVLHSKFHGEYIPIVFSESNKYKKVAIAVDFSTSDNKAINKAIGLGGTDAEYLLVHVLESTNAVVYGEDSFDMEREQDYQFLKQHSQQLADKGFRCSIALGYGNPKTSIPELVAKNDCDILVMGTHGHKTFKDILLGTTIEGVRHNIKVPLVLV